MNVRVGWRVCAWLCLWLAWLVPGLGHAAPDDDWPRTVRGADGSLTTIPKAPARILSTSVTLTGTLLAIDAPVFASATAANGRHFAQWAPVARERGVQSLWPAGRIDLEAVHAGRPDLILVSATGADAALAHVERLRQIAPTLVVDYSGQSWQALALTLGEATGRQAQARQRIAEFDARVAAARARLVLPAGQVNVISYNGPGASNPMATRHGSHGSLLAALGFVLEDPDPSWHGTTDEAGDFVWAPYEFLTQLRAPTTFLLRVDDAGTAAFLSDPLLARLPSVQTGQVYALGPNAFRIDYYSALEVLDRIERRFAP